MEHYKCIYMHKILTGEVPNYGIEVCVAAPECRGRMIKVPDTWGHSAAIASIKEAFVLIQGPKLFNSLPRMLRDFSGGSDKFKAILDRYLKEIPDEPNGPNNVYAGAINSHCLPSNSIQDWSRTLNMMSWTDTYTSSDNRAEQETTAQTEDSPQDTGASL